MKYSLLEKDEMLDMFESIIQSLENLMRVQGAKVPKREPRNRLTKVEQPEEDEVPLLQDVLNSLTGGMTIVNINESELPEWQGNQ